MRLPCRLDGSAPERRLRMRCGLQRDDRHHLGELRIQPSLQLCWLLHRQHWQCPRFHRWRSDSGRRHRACCRRRMPGALRRLHVLRIAVHGPVLVWQHARRPGRRGGCGSIVWSGYRRSRVPMRQGHGNRLRKLQRSLSPPNCDCWPLLLRQLCCNELPGRLDRHQRGIRMHMRRRVRRDDHRRESKQLRA